MCSPYVTETGAAPGQRRFVTATALALGTLTVVLGVWALVMPTSFATIIAPFAPYNAHYLHDVGAFQIAIGVSLLLAARTGDGLLVALGGYVVGGACHTLAHVIDRDHGGNPTDAPLLGAIVAFAMIALVVRARALRRAAPCEEVRR